MIKPNKALALRSEKDLSSHRQRSQTEPHYDLPVEFYSAFLDPYLKYTSGLFQTPDESLSQSIINMLDKHISLIPEAAKPNPQILEIGPGWGSLLKRLLDREIFCLYTGVNCSVAQNQYIKNHVDPNAQLIEATFEGANLESRFDIIYLLGSFCHFHHQETQLGRLKALLKPGGRIIFEDTFFVSEAKYKAHHLRRETQFVQDKVFGYAHILSVPKFLEAAENNGLNLISTLNHSTSYARTIDFWLTGLQKMKERQDQYSKVADNFIKYLKIGQRGWGYTIANHLFVFEG